MKNRRKNANRRQGSEVTENKIIATFANASSTSDERSGVANGYIAQRDHDTGQRVNEARHARLSRAFKARQTAERVRRRQAFEDAVAALLACAEELETDDRDENPQQTLVDTLSELCDCYIALEQDDRAALSLYYARNVSQARAADPFFLAKLQLVPAVHAEGEDAEKTQIKVTGGVLELTFDEQFDRYMAKYEVGLRRESHRKLGRAPLVQGERVGHYRPVYVDSVTGDRVDDAAIRIFIIPVPARHAYSPPPAITLPVKQLAHDPPMSSSTFLLVTGAIIAILSIVIYLCYRHSLLPTLYECMALFFTLIWLKYR
ncbi:hypothetical protein PENSPDRAFT_274796 [Peniophora sp. CONT]|nr:hypothetical protein PENSPDRAFT_274796 [Peniophora sp. CONT]